MNLSISDLKELIGVQPTAHLVSASAKHIGWRIVVLQRGWVVVGDVSQTGDEVTISNSSVIRNWGTSKGLGELALNGPQAATKLDPCGTVRAHVAAIVLQMESDASKWQK